MAYSDHKYYSTDGALSYNRLLKHFKDQANGARNVGLMSDHGAIRDTRSGMRRPRFRGSLVLVDMGDKKDTVNQRGEHVPKVEVIDHTEADRRRAVAQATKENRQVNNGDVQKKPQSRNHRQGGNTRKRRKPTTSKDTPTKQSTKRAKDIFD